MKDQLFQIKATNRRSASGSILLEAVLVAVVGAAFALAANRISPRGLSLARNYFPTETHDMMRTSAGATLPETAPGTNATVLSSPPSLAAPKPPPALQRVDRLRAVELFHNSHLQAGAIVFVDARDEEHYLGGHVPGAYEFDPYHPEKYFPAVLPVCQAAEQIVVYCNGGDCDDSQTAALLLRDVGIPNQKLFIYTGGITEWTNNHQPVETGERNSGNLSTAIQ
ncbi:MAG: rhodanese-like domain-containing protein, partial [Limisphaerales bacterium]